MNGLRKPFRRKSDPKKKRSRTCPDVQFKEFSLIKKEKLDLERTLSELGKPFPKETRSNLKKRKIDVKMPQVNKKPLARNGNLVHKKTRSRMN